MDTRHVPAPDLATNLAEADWTGTWTGAFGARTDLSVIVAASGDVEIHVLGHPVAINACEANLAELILRGPDISVTLQRVDRHAAQGSYVNAAGRRATALFRRA